MSGFALDATLRIEHTSLLALKAVAAAARAGEAGKGFAAIAREVAALAALALKAGEDVARHLGGPTGTDASVEAIRGLDDFSREAGRVRREAEGQRTSLGAG
jgi:methyl-accepting chemotaxis protein